METSRFTIRGLEAFTNGARVVCTEVKPVFEYIDNRPTSNRLGTSYTVTFVGQKYATGVIKTPETTPSFDNQYIAAQGGEVTIWADNFYATIYTDRQSKKPMFSLKADSVYIQSDDASRTAPYFGSAM